MAIEDASASRHLRYLCSRKTLPCADVVAYMESLKPETLCDAVQGRNESGKAPLHYAAQLRPGADGATLCAALLDRRADVNAITRRGHTALLFAAGRGHVESVHLLLDAGATPRVISASGDVPWKIPGNKHLDDDTIARLLAAEEEDLRPWQDFRQSEDAREAQLTYERASLQCCASQAAEQPRKNGNSALDGSDEGGRVHGARAELVNRVVHAARNDSVEALTVAIATAALEDKLATRAALRMIFSGESAVSAVCPMLRAFREDALGQEVAKQGGKRTRKVVVARLVSSLLHELRNSQAPKRVPSASIAEAAGSDVILAMEALLIKQPAWDEDCHIFMQLWSSALSLVSESSKSISELAWAIVGNKQVQGHQQQFAMCRDYVLLLRWSVGICPYPDCLDMTDEVVSLAASARCGSQLLDILGDLSLPLEVIEHMQNALKVEASKIAAKLYVPKPDTLECGTIPPYQLATQPEWVADSCTVQTMGAVIESMLLGLRDQAARLLIGVDTEWGDEEGGAIVTPSVVQLAVQGYAWVVDAKAVGEELVDMLLRFASDSRVRLLGFAFDRDTSKLAALSSTEKDLASDILVKAVMDIQRISMSMQPFRDVGQLVGLQRVAEVFLGRRLDKSLQCSDWDARPLTSGQLRYAAADAAVLLDLALAMGIHESGSAS
eukprot:TRINITY_DN1971_c0_g4_i1.p1 TRINITY_DN1971_c0_g4~~TRINITY_DN1971_c0_g4_i1.p1  ORF type:complete len:669 (-),score=91.10 TRINITY_DN1971_c0_g4_i1:350-2356(-)